MLGVLGELGRLGLGLAVLAGAVLGCGGDDDKSGAAPDAGPTFTGRADVEVVHYDVDLDLTTDRAVVALGLRTKTPGDCVTVGFRPDAALAVELGGALAARVDIDRAGDTIQACDPSGRGFPADTLLPLRVTLMVPRETWQDSDVGFSTTKDRTGIDFTYLVSWVGGCVRHGPCDAAPDRFATYRFVVHHLPTTQVLCSGDVTVAGDGQTTTCTFDRGGGPTYSTFALMARAAAWQMSELGVWAGGVSATLFDVPGSQIAAKLNQGAAAEFFAWMQTQFGAYPYGQNLRFVVGPTYWLGFEHPGNIALSQTLGTQASRYADGLLHTVLHEIAHQWAGDHATLASTYDFVWKEAMAEYLSFVFEDEMLEPGVSAKTAAAWKVFSTSSQYYLVPDEKPELLAYYGDVYGPGPLILFRQLEVRYGRAKVLAALDALIGTGAPRALSVADVEAALEAATGADLFAYFDAWVRGGGAPTWPEVNTQIAPVAGGPANRYSLAVSLTSADGVARGAAFRVRVRGAGAEADQFVDVAVQNPVEGGPYPAVEFTADFSPAMTEIDPFGEALVFPAKTTKPTRAGGGGAAKGPRRASEPWRARW